MLFIYAASVTIWRYHTSRWIHGPRKLGARRGLAPSNSFGEAIHVIGPSWVEVEVEQGDW